jgi:hypothetical protein
MNERIETIAVETLTFLRHNVLSHSDMEDISIPDAFLEKFTELIVHGCMNICEQQRLKILNNPNDPSWSEHLAECQTAMQQMFLQDEV